MNMYCSALNPGQCGPVPIAARTTPNEAQTPNTVLNLIKAVLEDVSFDKDEGVVYIPKAVKFLDGCGLDDPRPQMSSLA